MWCVTDQLRMAHHCPAHHPGADWQHSHAAADCSTVLEDLIGQARAAIGTTNT
jgi:hypothetical protein